MDHLDESGQPCTRHAHVAPARLLELATLGSRMPSFHHDASSKLQSLMMALDEISELLTEPPPEVRAAVDTAHAALRELNTLFAGNRALAKAPQRVRIPLGDVVGQAARRVAVKLRGELPVCDLRLGPPAVVHALSLVLDLLAGPSHHGRVVDVAVTVSRDRATIALAGPLEAAAKQPANTAEVLDIAAFAMSREDGELRCGGTGEKIVITLPVAVATMPMPALAKP